MAKLKLWVQSGESLYGGQPLDNEDESLREPDRLLKRKRSDKTEELGSLYKHAKTEESGAQREEWRKTYKESGI